MKMLTILLNVCNKALIKTGGKGWDTIFKRMIRPETRQKLVKPLGPRWWMSWIPVDLEPCYMLIVIH